MFYFNQKSFLEFKTTQGRVGGFSLIELLVTVSILSIVSVVAAPFYTGLIPAAKSLEAKTTLLSLQMLLENHYAEKGSYCPETDCLSAPYSYQEDASGNITQNSLVQDYLTLFKPKIYSNANALLYQYSIQVNGTDYMEYIISATPEANRGAPPTVLTLNHNGIKGGW